jgi:uncharacterized membrane protein HdeD (DUF308 family)
MIMHGIPLAPIAHVRLDMFLLGYIAAVSAAVVLFFLRFWRETRDFLFIAFAVFFIVQGGTRAFTISSQHPNVASVWIYVLRLMADLFILAAILHKNRPGA